MENKKEDEGDAELEHQGAFVDSSVIIWAIQSRFAEPGMIFH